MTRTEDHQKILKLLKNKEKVQGFTIFPKRSGQTTVTFNLLNHSGISFAVETPSGTDATLYDLFCKLVKNSKITNQEQIKSFREIWIDIIKRTEEFQNCNCTEVE